jgi:hypothetical protein
MQNVVVSGRALSLVLLFWSLVKVLLARAFNVQSGLPKFRESYDADRLPPLEASEREELPSFSRCVACGRCNEGEGARIAASRGAYPGLMNVVLSSSRSMPDFDAAALALSHVPDDVLAAKTRSCPTRVPFLALARFVRQKAMTEARSPGAS